MNVPPQEAIDDFMRERKDEVRPETLRAYEYPLNYFVEFCEDRGIESVTEIGPYELKKFKLHRQEDDIAYATLRNNMNVVRVFVRWCESSGLIEEGTADLMDVPESTNKDGRMTSDTQISEQAVFDLLEYQKKFHYATRTHAITRTIWDTCFRIGTIISLDVSDFDRVNGVLSVRNRPMTGTPLKKGNRAERDVTLTDNALEVLTDYVDQRRTPVTDEHGREPLFTTTQRITRNTYRKNLYGDTRPCVSGGGCPHDKEPDTCEWALDKKQASRCPSTVSPHPLRRAAITYHLKVGWPKEKLSERADVSVKVLEEHYDARTNEEKRQGRNEFVDRMNDHSRGL